MSFKPTQLKTFDSNKIEFLKNSESPNFSTENKSKENLHDLFKKILQDGIHGLCFSMYEEGQKPGDIISKKQVEKRLTILKPHIKWIRSFSCIEGNEHVPVVAKEMGLKTMVGAWLGSEEEKNAIEIKNLIDLSKRGMVDIAVVGNEVLYRNDLSKERLIELIQQVKKNVSVPVGYVDAYYEFSTHPDLVDVCDVILANCYPFWESCPFEYSLAHMQQMYQQAKLAAKGKKVIITETGWPSKGQALDGAQPSYENSLKYFLNTQLWAQKEGIEIFYFSSFDESWKVGAEGDVGAYWGLWDKDGQLKF